jgi:hypothetical protein
MDQETNIKIKRFLNDASPKVLQFLVSLFAFAVNLVRTIISEIFREIGGGGGFEE